MRTSMLTILVWTAAQVVASTASACPVCDTGTGEQVRAGLFDKDFGRTLITVLLPFPILLGIVVMIHFGLPWPGARRVPERNDNSTPRKQR